MAKRGVVIGLSNLVYAKLIDDPPTGQATYEPPIRIPGAIQATVNPNASNATLFADDGPFETAATIGEITLELNIADLPLEVQADLLGHTLQGGVLIRKASDVPPWVAVGFKTLKSNGKYRYTWLAKGKFALPEQNNQTKGDSIEWNTPTITGSFVKRECDDEWERHIDEDHIDFVPEMAENWFTNPYGGTPDLSPLSISNSNPSDGASGVSTSTAIVLTFNKTLALSTVHTGNFMLLKDSGSAVDGNLTLDSSRKQVTFTPSSQLDAATDYMLVVSSEVKDIYGVKLGSAQVIRFTTA